MSPSRYRKSTSVWLSQEFWLPLLLLIVTAAIFAMLWISVQRAETAKERVETRVTAEQVRLRLESWIDSRIAVVENLGNMWPGELAGHPDVYRTTVRRYLALYPGLQAVNWIDSDWVIRIVVPKLTNEPALNKDLHKHPSPGVVTALRRAETTGQLARSPVVDLLQGGNGFTVYRPVVDRAGKPDGFINGVFRIDQLVNACLAEPNLHRHFTYVLIDEDGRLAYRSRDDIAADELPNQAIVPVRIVNRPWILHFARTSPGATPGPPSAARLLVGAAFALTILLALLLHGLLRRERELGESERKYRLLVENQTDLVVEADAQGRFLFVSPSFCRLFGKSEDELIGQEVYPFVLEEDRDATRRALGRIQSPPHLEEMEHRALTENGWRWLSWVGTAVLDEKGHPTSVIGVGRDITARKRLEDQLRQSQKLEAIGQLAGGIAHDFNNILQAILGYLELTKRNLKLGGNTEHDLEQIRKAALRAAALTRQLLAFGRRQVLRPADFDLNATVLETMHLLQRLIGENITLTFEACTENPVVHADPGQMEQVIMNLCINARDAMPDGGRLVLATTCIQFDEAGARDRISAKAGSWVGLSVSDTGIGMDQETRARIFEPFFTTKEVGRGTGLGLSTVYGIVEQHGGWIELDTAPGRGSTFTAFLPRVETAPTLQAASSSKAVPGGAETLLLAEDEPMVRDVATKVLEDAGYSVIVCATGSEALRAYRDRRDEIDLVILDAVMPGLSGWETYQRIRDLTPRPRVLMISGYGAEVLSSDEMGSRGVELLEKPFESETLLLKVREILDRRP